MSSDRIANATLELRNAYAAWSDAQRNIDSTDEGSKKSLTPEQTSILRRLSNAIDELRKAKELSGGGRKTRRRRHHRKTRRHR